MRRTTWKKMLVTLGVLLITMAIVSGIQSSNVRAAEGDSNVIYIHNQQELLKMVSNPSGNYKLANDIRLSDDNWNYSIDFKGTLDGCGYTITGFKSEGNSLFHSVNPGAVLKNLTLSGNITCTKDSDVKSKALLAVDNNGTIENCVTSGKVYSEYNYCLAGMVINNYNIMRSCTNHAEVKESRKPSELESEINYDYSASGICAYNLGYITDCMNDGNISGDLMYVCGLVGLNSNPGSIMNCTNNGNITVKTENSTSSNLTAGVAGSNDGLIYKCVNKGIIDSGLKTNSIGGIVNYLGEFASVIDCTNYGNINSNSEGCVGGIVAESYLYGSTEVDGKSVLDPGEHLISGCNNYGKLTGHSVVGGIVGNVSTQGRYIKIVNCNNYSDISGYTDTLLGGIVGSLDSEISAVTISNCSNTGTLRMDNEIVANKVYGLKDSEEMYCTDAPHKHQALSDKNYTLNHGEGIDLGTNNQDVRLVYSDNQLICETNFNYIYSVGLTGTCHIFVVYNDGAIDCVTINVINPLIALDLNEDYLNIEVGKSTQLTAKKFPGDTTDTEKICWSSSDSSIVTVDENGNVKAIKSGDAFIIASAGSITAKCEVTVYEPDSEILNGLVKSSDGQWYLYDCDVFLNDYTGFYKDKNYGWWLVEEGKVSLSYTGLYNDKYCGWYLVEGGKVSFSYTGLYNDKNCGWWYVNEGRVAFEYTGLYNDANCGWWYVNGGRVAFEYTGLYDDVNCGWWYVNGGRVAFEYTGLYNDANCGWWYVNGGRVAFEYTGLYNDANCGWWYVNGGRVAFEYTGLYNDANCGWWYVNGGRVAFEYTGLYNDANCGWWYVNGGRVAFEYTGLYNDANCGWWLVEGGRVAFEYTGLYNDANCGWWLIGGGRVTFEYNGLYNDARYGWWMIAGGCVNFNYAG